MIKELTRAHSKLNQHQRLRIILSRYDWELSCDGSDVIKTNGNTIQIHRENGNISIINPNHIVLICTARRGEFL